MRLIGYYRRFIKDYGKISQPLTNLLKKDDLLWCKGVENAFDHLKVAICKASTLSMPKFQMEFKIECDVGNWGIGAVVSQGG